MPRSPWSVAGEVLISVVLLVGPPVLAMRLDWPLDRDTTWVRLWQYLRGGSIPDEVVLAVLIVALWGVWAVHLVIVVLDVVALARGVVPRVGLVRLVWVLVAGGTTATSTHATALAAHTDTVAEAPVTAEAAPGEHTPPSPGEQAEAGDATERTRALAGFGFDSAGLTPDMAELLEPTIGLIADFRHPEKPVVITGHTDPVGDPSYNQALSEQRAQAVADHLAGRLDADVQIDVQGKAATQPPSNSRASFGEYRRVEISYTVQRPAHEPELSVVPEPESPAGAASAPERVGQSVTTAGSEATMLDVAAVGAVSGVVGLGVGYAAGRRRNAATPPNQDSAPDLTTGPDDPEDESATENSAQGRVDLVRQDAEGLARGAIDEDGYVLISDTLRVNCADGVAFVGAHAASVLTAVVTGHAPGPVVATRAAAAALAAENTQMEGVHVVPDLARVQVAVEAELLTCARRRAEDGDEVDRPAILAPRVLVAVEASDLGADQGRPTALTTSGAVVCVLGDTDHAGVAVGCEDTHRVRVRARDGVDTHDGALRCWSLQQGQEEHERAPVDDQPPLASEHPATAGQGELDQAGEQQPDAPPVTGSPTRARVRLFAPHVECEVNGNDVLHGTRSSTYTLLAVLALGPREGVWHHELTQVLAPEMPEMQARRFRANAISALRKAVRDALGLGTKAPIVENEKGRYRLQWEYFDIDVREFCGLYAEARSADDSREEARLRKMVDLCRSDLLVDVQDEWFTERRAELRSAAADVYMRLLDYVDDDEERIRLIDCALRADPLNEVLHQEKMKHYASLGRKDAVHRCFQSLKDELRQCGSKPGPESRSLFESLVR